MKKTLLKAVVVSVCVFVSSFFSLDYAGFFSRYTGKKFDGSIDFIISNITKFFPGVPVTRDVVIAIPFWIIITLIFFSLINRLSSRLRYRRKKETKKQHHMDKKSVDTDKNEDTDISKTEEINNDVVVQFFLRLFKTQVGANKNSPGKYSPVTTVNVWPNRVYELSVLHAGDWLTRRLTIGPLSEDGVSKSVCYYVIYDDHLVLKIPSEPITDFQYYLACIKADMLIADRLKPKECVIPRVSVILGRLLSAGSKSTDNQDIEKAYVDRLTTNSSFQEYLKIGKSFVFFMDLSRYYFLSNVINEMHDMDNALPREILGFQNMIWDSYEFEGRYGQENAHIGFEMRSIYEEYEREVGRLLLQYGVTSPLPSYTIRYWFLVHLSGKGRIESEGDLSQSFIEDMNTLSRESMVDNRVSIESYRMVIREYIYKATVARYKAEMSSIVTNIVGLLLFLGKRSVAIRDLKPDNLLIAGDVDKYPYFLRSSDQFTMGFIDVETAVDYGKEEDEKIMQPQLGGTPKYATPSHLFPNEWIIKIYGDIRRILHFQDWYACVAMIYRVITGGHLFEKTAALLPEIKRILEGPLETDENVVSVMEYVSRMFFKSAIFEFKEKINKDRIVLNKVSLIIRADDKHVLMDRFKMEKKILEYKVVQKINSQNLFENREHREVLYRSSVSKIKTLWQKTESRTGDVASRKQEINLFFREFIPLKKQLELLDNTIAYLKAYGSEIPVATMMEVMFNTVISAMVFEIWGAFKTETTADPWQAESYDDLDETI